MRHIALALVPMVLASGCVPLYGLRQYGAEGRVLDERTGEPVSGAIVTVGRNEPTVVETQDDGSFSCPAAREWFLFLLAPVPQDPSTDVVSPVLSVEHPAYEKRTLSLRDFPLEFRVVSVGVVEMKTSEAVR